MPVSATFRSNAQPRQPWVSLSQVREEVTVRDLDQVLGALDYVSTRVEEDQLYAVGFVSYECARAFDPALPLAREAPGNLPLMWFALGNADHHPDSQIHRYLPPATNRSLKWVNNEDFEHYRCTINHLLEKISAGEVYQVNYATRLSAKHCQPGDLVNLSLGGAPFSAYIETGEFALASASPELFFALEGTHITCQPMKGTAARGPSVKSDLAQQAWLAASAKDRAENLMILDMVRNDLGRIAQPGSVGVPDKFSLQKFPTLWQMTSTVQATTPAKIVDIFAALFPGASITGAPKRAAMDVIADREPIPRGPYTGAIGVLAPGRRAVFNIAIRTAWLNKTTGQAQYGVGSGIVADSTAVSEWRELTTKSLVLTPTPRSFDLLETMCWVDRTIPLLDGHLKRLTQSARYFDFPINLNRITTTITQATRELGDHTHRVRLTLAANGHCKVVCTPCTGPTHKLTAAVKTRLPMADSPVDKADVFLYHKTSYRRTYEDAEAQAGGEVLLYNQQGCLTESTIANLVYRYQGQLFTPPESDGLLPGVYRAYLIKTGQVLERTLKIDELPGVSTLYAVNALRGWREIEVVEPRPSQIQATP